MRITYNAEIEYEFSVEGKDFRGDRVAYGDYGSSSPSHAEDVAGRYPPGKEVTVYYLPENPAECLLEPGASAKAWILPIVGVAFVVAGGVTAVCLPKRNRE